MYRPIEEDPADVAEVDVAEAAAEDAELAEEFEHVFAVPGDGDIAVGATMHQGWKVSYRTQQPELRDFGQWRKRWSLARQRWERSGKALAAPQVRRTPEAQLKVQRSWRERKRVGVEVAVLPPPAA